MGFTVTNVHACLPRHIFTAAFHTDKDVITLLQFMYYKLKNQKEKKKSKISNSLF